MMRLPIIIVFIVVSAILGYRVISKVPPLLHTPLMSGMNALSGITILGAVAVYAAASPGVKGFSAAAIILAMINVAGGLWVTQRMLEMFKKKKK